MRRLGVLIAMRFSGEGAFSNSQGGMIPIFRNGQRLTTGEIQIYLHGSAFAGESIIWHNVFT